MNTSQAGRNKNFVSARRVAELAGVSRSAVSRAFTDGASVSEQTRLKVMQAAEALGYHVNHLARGLIRERSNIVSIVVKDVRNPYQAELIDKITSSLQLKGRVAVLINTDGAAESAEHALKMSLNYRADATIMLSGSPASSLVDTCIANGQHVILINRDETQASSDRILVDNATAAQEALKLHLRAGCRRHLVVSSQNRTPSLVARETAYVAAAREAGVAVEVIAAGPTGYATGLEAARQAFGRSETPDAAFCVTDLLALGFMDGARRDFGVDVPRDLCVIGFDDIEQAGWESYQLTTFRQPLAAMAEEITRLLTEGDAAAGSGQTITLAVTPVWRRSVRPR